MKYSKFGEDPIRSDIAEKFDESVAEMGNLRNYFSESRIVRRGHCLWLYRRPGK